eukprot:g7147.t1
MDNSQRVMSVEDYTKYFIKKIVKDEKFRADDDLKEAGLEFYNLLQSFAQEGDREDVRTPFKIMKDEVISEWRTVQREMRAELIRRVFGILDVVHEQCQESVQHRINGTEVSYTILEELRLRMMKMVTGETWKEAVPLRLEAMKRMHRYRVREIEANFTTESKKSVLKQKTKHLTVKKLKWSVVGHHHSLASWTDVFNELLLSSGSRLAPLLFAILDENQLMEKKLGMRKLIGSEETSHFTSITLRELSMKSCSSGGSSSCTQVIPEETNEDKEAVPQYYKSLNSDLNAKLKLFKQQGRIDEVIVRDGLSEVSNDSSSFYPNDTPPVNGNVF